MKKTVLVTGATGGLGAAIAREFVAQGWRVYASDEREPRDEIRRDLSGIFILRMDITSDVSVQKVYNLFKKMGIILDLIINNAGIDRYFPLSEAPVERFREVFEVNVFGAYRVNQIFLPLMRQPGGRIVHIGSESYQLTVPFLPYPLSKNLLERYAKVLRQELRYSGIDVVVIRPGAIDTMLIQQLRDLDQGADDWNLKAQFGRFTKAASREVGRVASPDRIARFIYNKSIVANPSAVYRINNQLQLRLAALLPFRLMAMIVRWRLSGGVK